MTYYDHHKLDVLERIDIVFNTIENRLIPTFDSIEEEANTVEQERLSELGQNFNPDTMDEGMCYEDAYSEGAYHYTIHHEMKQEFLNHQVTVLFHLFEKDCKAMCPQSHSNGELLKSKLEEIGVDCSTNSNWYKVNKELRLIANVIKHGTGHSYDQLKQIKPEYFKEQYGFLLQSDLEISLENIRIYKNAMKDFWIEFFDIVIPS